MAPSRKKSIIWFRKGLRLHDNPALLEACKDAENMYPVFVLDPFFLQQSSYKVSVNRYNFLLESLRDLNDSFMARGSRLLVLRGKPEEVFPRVLREWDITHLCFEIDTEPYARTRDARIQQLAEEAGVQVQTAISHTLYDTEMLVARNGGRPPLTMVSFCNLVNRVGDPQPPAPDPPATLPPLGEGKPSADPATTAVPTWQEVGFKEAPTLIFKGGETEALRRLSASLTDTRWVADFKKPDTDPSAFERPATTVLSPYLKFGCLSARLFHVRLLEVYRKHTGHSQPPVSLRGQLLWREFFYTVGAHTPNFHRMEGNPLCKQIDWDANEEHLTAWREARTGFPWIDAIMTQLRQWGWMHHLARHSVACFLTRGDLYVSWERGMEVFEEYLIDQDHYLNAANWMWLSASAFFNQYFRVYSPISFGKKYDPDGKFVRKFLPVLKDMPSKYIYEPWTAPPEVQRRAGCIIGRDYPAPIVDHPVVSKRNISRMAAAYRANKSAMDTNGGGDCSDDDVAPTSMAAAAAASKALRGKPSKKTSASVAIAATAAARKAANKAAAGGGGGNDGGKSESAVAAASSAIAAASAFTARWNGARSKKDVAAVETTAPEDLALAAAEAAAAAAMKGTSKARTAGSRGGRGGNKRQRTIQEALKPMPSGD
ncbi:hypothetical protein VaNZ11_016339 [Volvox africanus]|uniref:Photolyase/cryptochrome alpha/beta domain-containing protein n=1 Tax=Volvox africanus TaxID=51714 RepID=A0ABQ5SMK5_9CHLO|nr:hypothetical protein VaNZ11_016339 [Volvox africanus]